MGVVEGAMMVVSWFAGATGTALTAAGFYAATAGVLLAGTMVVANALKPKIPSGSLDGQGQILSTTKSNTDAVPVVYGENKLAGNIIWQKTNNYSGGTTNKDYWAIFALADGDSEDFIKMYNKEDLMTDQGSNIFTSSYVQAKGYTSSGSGINIKDISFPYEDSSNVVLGSTIFGDIDISVSSNSADKFNLIDADINTYWQPTSYEDEYILLSDTGTPTIESVSLYLPDASRRTIWSLTAVHTIEFKVQYSDDNATWHDASDVYTNSSGISASSIRAVVTETVQHQYWRVYFTTIRQAEEFEGGGSYYTPSIVFELDVVGSDFAVVSVPEGITYMAVHQLYEATNTAHVQLSNIMTVIQGKKIDVFTSSSTVSSTPQYSSNPADIVFDIMKERLNITASDLDISSFWSARQFATSNNLSCNIAYAQQQNTASAIEAALATMRGHITYSDGKWHLIYEHPQSSLSTLMSADIIQNSLSVAMVESTDLANKVIVKYINPDDEWQIAEVEMQDDDLIGLDGQISEYVLEVKGCTSQSQAMKLAELTLNKMRYSEDSEGNRIKQTPLNISFATSLKMAHIEVGDVYTVDFRLLNYPRKFEIVSVETDTSGTYMIEAVEHCATHYKDSANNDIIT